MGTALFDLFQRGGPVMWPILLCSITALAIMLERLIALSRVEVDNPSFLDEVRHTVQARQWSQALKLCELEAGPLGRMVKAGIRRIGRPRGEIREAIEEAGSREIPALERYVPILGTVAHLAPLLGLLGTVTGLVRCFQVIQEKATTINPVNPGDLAGGIWEALLTTVFGLMVAIPAYAVYNALVHRINGIVHHLEASASDLLELLTEEGPSATEPSVELTVGSGRPRKVHAT
ncbi:MAG: MotA/TolQ/ExbB proton channel family protein [Candidatus Omnitrophica bacterium]|nr:MotA/TolQ/ExbB proton channel family protein [Candidatus Omnitrophota bacterium]